MANISTTEAARRLRESGVYPTASDTMVKRWVERGIIRGYRPAERTRWQIPEEEIERIISDAKKKLGYDCESPSGESLAADDGQRYEA